MSSSDIVIEGIQFHPEGCVIAFFDPTDMRVDGRVVVTRQASISRKHPDYNDDIEGLHHKALRMLKNALEDWQDSEPWQPEDDTDDDDERGMGE